MDKTYASLEEMLKGVGVDDGFTNSVKEELEKRQLSNLLFALRCKANLTQSEMSEKIKCSQSRVSKIENSFDKDLCLGDILEYTSALKLNVEIGIYPSMKIADKIKHHAFMIKGYIDELAHLAKKDDTILEGVSKFFYDAVFNLVGIITGAAKKMHEPKSTQGNLSVSTNVELGVDCKCSNKVLEVKNSKKHENTDVRIPTT
jgi:transcriptional regulator with XRE-family HTH domain